MQTRWSSGFKGLLMLAVLSGPLGCDKSNGEPSTTSAETTSTEESTDDSSETSDTGEQCNFELLLPGEVSGLSADSTLRVLMEKSEINSSMDSIVLYDETLSDLSFPFCFTEYPDQPREEGFRYSVGAQLRLDGSPPGTSQDDFTVYVVVDADEDFGKHELEPT